LERLQRDPVRGRRTGRGAHVRPPIQYGKTTSRPDQTLYLAEHSGLIVEFVPEIGHEHEITAVAGKCCSSSLPFHQNNILRSSGSGELEAQLLKHLFLKIHSQDLPLNADGAGKREREIAGPGTDIRDRHPRDEADPDHDIFRREPFEALRIFKFV
jgi:hypothetical protein